MKPQTLASCAAISFVNALPIEPAQGLVRFDRVGGALSDELVQVNLKSFRQLENIGDKLLEPQDAWEVNMLCPGIEESLCEKARVGLIDAGRLIAESLRVSRVIKMNATFKSFGASQGNILGRATYGSSFVVKKQSGYYTMGQALVKQHMTDIAVPMSDVDIVAEFNSDYNWYFKDSDMNITGKHDFTYVALHEITHGLGFQSSMLKRTNSLNITYLSPQVNKNADKYFLQPLDIYDAYIANTDQSVEFKGASETINKLGFQAEPIVDSFNKNSDQLQTWQNMYDISTRGPNTLFFHTVDGKKIELYSPETFRPGSSLHHLAAPFANTEDFVMVPTLKGSVTVEQLMRSTNSTTVYGKGIRSIMTSIGWPTIDNPETQIIQIAVDYGMAFKVTGFGTILIVMVLELLL